MVRNADSAIRHTTTAIAVKPKPRLDALLITYLNDAFYSFYYDFSLSYLKPLMSVVKL